MSERFNEKILGMDIELHHREDLIKEKTTEYHHALLELMDMKVNGGGYDNNDIWTHFDKVNNLFSGVVRLQKSMIEMGFDIMKETMEDAFRRSNLYFDEKGEMVC
jgi:hypothetical protein